MTESSAPYAHAIERLATGLEKNSDTLEMVRTRIHDLANNVSTTNMQLATISSSLSHIERSTTDHEGRLRSLEAVPPHRLDARLEKVETAVLNIRLRMALWAGGGGVIGGLAAFLVPKMFGG